MVGSRQPARSSNCTSTSGVLQFQQLASCTTESSVLVVLDAFADDRFARHQGDLRFLAAAPIVCHGHKVGALCLGDKQPRQSFNTHEMSKLQGLADVVASLLEERTASLFESQHALAVLVVGVLARLQRPLQACIQLKKQLVGHIRSPASHQDQVMSCRSLMLDFSQKVKLLHREIERSLQLVVAFYLSQQESLLSEVDLEFRAGGQLLSSSQKLVARRAYSVTWAENMTLKNKELKSSCINNLLIAFDAVLSLEHGGLCADDDALTAVGLEIVTANTNTQLAQDSPGDGDLCSAGRLQFTVTPAQSSCVDMSTPAVSDLSTAKRCVAILCKSILSAKYGDMEVHDGTITLWIPCTYRKLPKVKHYSGTPWRGDVELFNSDSDSADTIVTSALRSRPRSFDSTARVKVGVWTTIRKFFFRYTRPFKARVYHSPD